MDFQHRPGGKTGSGGVASASESNRDRRERLRQLALETIDINKVSMGLSCAGKESPVAPVLLTLVGIGLELWLSAAAWGARAIAEFCGLELNTVVSGNVESNERDLWRG